MYINVYKNVFGIFWPWFFFYVLLIEFFYKKIHKLFKPQKLQINVHVTDIDKQHISKTVIYSKRNIFKSRQSCPALVQWMQIFLVKNFHDTDGCHKMKLFACPHSNMKFI